MTDSRNDPGNERRPARASTAAGALLAVATAACVAVAFGSEATAARTQAAIQIASTPKVQTVATRIVVHGGRPALEFGTATFTITVKNPGPTRLFGVTVTAPRSPACNRTIGTLAAGASTAYSCSAASVARSYKNVLTVSGRRASGTRDLATADAATTATAVSLVK